MLAGAPRPPQLNEEKDTDGDKNDEGVPAFRRKYTNEVRRCDEMARKLRCRASAGRRRRRQPTTARPGAASPAPRSSRPAAASLVAILGAGMPAIAKASVAPARQPGGFSTGFSTGRPQLTSPPAPRLLLPAPTPALPGTSKRRL